MKEVYKNQQKLIKRKISYTLFGEVSYKEDFAISIKPRVAIFIFAKAMEEIEWGIGVLSDESLDGANLTKVGKVLQTINVTYKDPISLEIKSVSEDKYIDWGTNYRNVQLLIDVYKKITTSYTRADYEKIEEEINKRNSWENYEVPEHLPEPKIYKEPDRNKFILGFSLFCLPFILVPIIFIETFIPQRFIIGIEVIWSFIFFYLLKYLFRWSWYTNEEVINRITYTLLLTSMLCSILLNYAGLYVQEKFHLAGFDSYLKMLPMISFDFDVFMTAVLPRIFLGLVLCLIPYLLIPINIMSFQIWRFPEEVTDMIFYFKFKKRMTNTSIKAELSKCGWTDERMQNELLKYMDENYSE